MTGFERGHDVRSPLRREDNPEKYAAVIAKRFPRELRVGDVCERVAMLLRDGTEWENTLNGAGTNFVEFTHVRITGVPGGQRKNLGYVKIDPRARGNGRADRQVKRSDPASFQRHYRLVEEQEGARKES